MSTLNATILDLASQGFFCLPIREPFIDRNGNTHSFVPYFPSDKSKNPRNLPTLSESKNRVITKEEWAHVFAQNDWKYVKKISIAAGGNGVLAFDFDIKHFQEGTKDYDQAWGIWTCFKFELEVKKIPFYFERTKSCGEHVILLCEDGVENFQPDGDLCPKLGVKFIECFAEKRGNSLPQGITIAPSPGYTRLSDVDLLNLKRINSEQRKECLAFFDKYKQESNIKQGGNRQRKKVAVQPEKYVHNVTIEELYEHIRNKHCLVRELEGIGYTRQGNRMRRPGKSEADIELFNNDKKIKCYSSSDPLYNNGRPCDIMDVMRISGNVNCMKDLVKSAYMEISPHQYTKELSEAKTVEDVTNGIQKTSKKRLILNFYIAEDGEKLLEVVTFSGGIKFFSPSDFSHRKVEETGIEYFYHKDYTNEKGSFCKLRGMILDEMGVITPKLLIKHPTWQNDKFYYKSTEDCHVKCKFFKDPTASFGTWKERVYDVAVKYPATALCMLMAFAAPFAGILHQSFGINLVGDSDIGKTMCLRIAKGMYTDMSNLDNWDFSPAAIEREKYKLANGILCLDEMMEANDIGLSSIMKLCGVAGRTRCDVSRNKVEIAESLMVPVLILSSSEISLQERAKYFKIVTTKGMLNRFLDIEVNLEDFPSKKELSILYDDIERMIGVPIHRLCECLEGVSASELSEKFSEYKRQFDEELKEKPLGQQRVHNHLMFLKFVSEFITYSIGIDGAAMYEKALILFERFLVNSIDILDSKSAINIRAIKEKIHEMVESPKYIARNSEYGKITEHTCFFVDADYDSPTRKNEESSDVILCFSKDKLAGNLSSELGISKKEALEGLSSLKLFHEYRTRAKIAPIGKWCHVYKIDQERLDALDPDDTEAITDEE